MNPTQISFLALLCLLLLLLTSHSQMCDATCLTCSGTTASDCESCDQDFTSIIATGTCDGLSTANSHKYNTAVMQTINTATVKDGIIVTDISDGGSNTYDDMADLLTDCSTSYITLFNTVDSVGPPKNFNTLQVSLATLDTDAYKVAIKISGQFTATCTTNQINILTLQISGYPSDQQIMALKSPAGGGNFVTSSKYFAASGGALTIKLIYSQASGGACGSIVIGNIAVVGYICDASCTSCTSTTSCSCASNEYLTTGNVCGTCSTGCSSCTVSGCSICSTNPTSYYLLGTSCQQNCGGTKYTGVNGLGEPVCLNCMGICATCTGPSTCSTCNIGRLYYGGTGCGTNCPFGQYALDANTCALCSTNCATCSGLNVCTSCGLLSSTQSYLHSDNTCYTTCPGATYSAVSNGAYLCLPCPTGCALCSLNIATVQCSKCQFAFANYYYSSNSCVQNCPDGKYGGSNGSGEPTCLPCDSPCAKCSGSGTSACLSCSTGRLLFGATTCGSCITGTYANSATTCALCDLNCATCQTTPTNCLTCGLLSSQQSYLHSDKVCYINCPGNTYGKDDSGSFVCATCPTGCPSCSLVSGNVQCSICTSVTSVQYYFKNNGCTSNCGSGFYGGPDPGTSNPTCFSCVAPCANCNSATVCTSCATGLFFAGSCFSSCPFGHYADSGTTCAPCNNNCASCVTLATKCLSCGLLSSTQAYLYTDNKCYTICPGGSYATSTSGVYLCTACPTGCTTCSLVSGSVQCTVCASVSSINFYLSGNSCVQTCPNGKYAGADGSGNPTCVTCDSPCATCTAAGTSACLSCSTDRLIYGTNTCGSCATKTFADSASTCAPCNANCDTCDTSATNCLTCGLISTVQSYLYSDNKCYTICPGGSYKDSTGGPYLCTLCPTGCAQCSLVLGNVECTLCTSVSGTQYYLSSTSCTNNCGNGKYGGINNSLQPVCLACVSPCNNCLSATACTSCSTGVLVFGTNTCTSQCAFGQYADSSTTCANCNSNCASCSSAATTCTSCQSISGSTAYLHTDNKCYAICPTGTYSSVVNGANLCIACPTGCDTCSLTLGAVQCSKCKTVSSTNFYLSGTSCVQTCPAGKYAGADGSGNPTCVTCDSPCATCTAAGTSACLSCSTDRLIYGTNTCGSCATKTFADSASTCAPCNANCDTCDTSATNCLTCGLISTVQSYLYSDKKCYTICPGGSYKDSTGGPYLCTSCPIGCAQCSLVLGSVQCTLCTTVAGVQFFLESNACSSTCSSGKFGGIDANFKPVCSACQSPCATCLTATVCLTCSTGVLIYGTTFCSTQCPFGQYIVTSSTCGPCNANCASCTTSSTTCSSCGLISGSQAYLYSDNVCYVTCPNGSYKSNVNGAYLCVPCPVGCALCSLNAATVECTQCKTVTSTNFYLSGKSCVQTCPAGKYGGADGNSKPVCITCDSPCATCTAAGTSACLSCSTDRLIYGTNTCGSCATKTFADSASTCAPCNANCDTCDTSATNCLTCGLISTVQSYLYSDNKCYTICPGGSYKDSTGGPYLCTLCPTGCAQCSLVLGNVECTLCTSVSGTQYYLSSTSCTNNCGNGKYGGPDATSGEPTCIACTPPCANCLSAISCLSCSTGRLVSGGTTCPTDCPSGQYATSSSTCGVCNSNCATCSGASTTCASCGILSGAQSYLYSDNKCYINCPTGAFKKISDSSCQDCHGSCNGCIDTTTNCIACAATYFRVIGSTTCTQACGNGYYGDTTTNICTACPIGCALCSMSSSTLSCTKCSSFAGVQYYLSGTSCVSLCADGKYQGIDASNNLYTTCLSCSGCATCAGSATYCTSCSTGRLIVGQNTCGTCPEGQWADSSTTCALCSPNCKACSGGSNSCTACPFSSLGYQLFLHSDSICYQSCPSTYYGNTGSKQCASCAASCDGCVNSNTNCISCAATYFRVIGSNACTQSCGAGYYGQTNTNLCTACPIGCVSCSQTSSVVSCTQCTMIAGVQYYLHSGICKAVCPALTFGGLDTNSKPVCRSCDNSCATCNGTASTNCLSCSGTYLKYAGTQCVATCDGGQFSSSNNLCALCSSNCKTCITSSTNCLTCGSSPAGITLYLYSAACVAVCPDTYYADSFSHQCTDCNDSCHKCSGPLATDCLTCTTGSLRASDNTCQSSCPNGQYSKNNVCYPCISQCAICSSATSCSTCQAVAGMPYYLDSNTNTCNINCPADTYPDSGLTCIACTSPCLTCSGGTSICTSCDTGTVTPYLKYGLNSCAAGCPNGQYAPASSYVCLPCNDNCLTCSSSATHCLSCGLSLSSGLQLYLSSNTCLASCPSGKYGASNACANCDGSCDGCSQSSTNCISCASTYFRKTGSTLCIKPCPDGYYGDSGTSLCTLCPSGCKLCSISSSVISCTVCQASAGVQYYLDSTTNTCVPQCPSTYYAAGGSTPTCTACSGNCATCLDSSTCITCVASRYLGYGETTCYSACPDGQYYPTGSLKCQLCNTFCAKCSGTATTCTSCTSLGGVAYFLDSNTCTATCPTGKFGNITDFTCQSCATGCASCFNSTTSSCNSCAAFNSSVNYYLVYGTFTCQDTCPNGQFASNFKCLLCSSNCLTCTTTSNNCLTCGFSVSGADLFLSGSKCLANCPQGYWGNITLNTCDKCADGCVACTGPQISNCTICGNVTTTIYYKYIGSSICNTTCPDGQFMAASNPNYCSPCSSVCVTCSYLAENCTSATCAQNYFFLNNQCLINCPNHYYADTTSRQCLGCATGCATCFGSGTSACTVCSSSNYLQIGGTTCSGGCNGGEFKNNVGNVCTKCVSACATCTSYTICQSCQNVNGIAYFLNGTECSVTCPSTQFGKLLNNQCTNCADGCLTCFDSSLTNCYSCTTSSQPKDYFLVYATTVCALSCPNGQYKNVTAYKCLLCSSVCLTCEISSTNCLTCGPSPFGYSVFLFQTKCLATCPNSYWANSTAYTCDACTVGCATCFNIGLSSCTVCNNDSSTIYYKYIGSTVCNTTCPDGQFVSAAIHNLCQPCSSICSTCVGSAENCTSATCAQNYFFLNNQCLINCPNHYYADTTSRQCLGCATGCATCFGSGTSACTVCSSSNYLQIGGTTCSGGCNGGEFKNNVGNVCTKCVSACATCTSYTICQSCQNVNGIAYFLNGTECSVTCPSTQFGKTSNNQCTNCADGCLTCFGSSLTNCYSCTTSSQPKDYYLEYGTNTCRLSCPAGQYSNITSHQCLLCSANCLTCTSTSTTCTSCGYSTVGYLLFLQNSACLSTCSFGLFRNTTSLKCQACMSACTSCNTYSLSTCYGCQNVDNSGTITKYYKYVGDTICGTSCPLGQYIDDANSPNACLMCDSNCVGCYISATNCTLVAGCKVNYFYNNATNSCVLVCPDGTYGNVVTKFCEFCATGCALCYGSGLSKCTKCLSASGSNYFLMINLNQCSTGCNSNQYGDSTFFKCFPCNSACATCSSNSVCASCTSVNGVAYFLNSSKCQISCPSNQYGNINNFQCTNCANQCATCFGGLNTQCYSCKSYSSTNYYLVFGTNLCNSTCPDGQYQNSTDFTCRLCSTGCSTCVNASLVCLTCGFSSQGFNLFLQNNKCLMNCLNGYWANSTAYTCDACTVGCATCFNIGLSSCTVCNNDSSTIYYKYIGSTVCNTTCPDGQFVSAAIHNLCQPCSSICSTCVGSAENCTSATCAQNYFFLNNQCLINCPNHYYADTTSRQCLGCATGCATCFGSGTSACTVCSSSNYLQIGGTTCSGGCNGGEFKNNVGNVCTKCVSACATCTSYTICQSCQNVNGIAYFLNGTECSVTCPSTQFGKLLNNQCTNCADGCLTCFDSSLTNCYSCTTSSQPKDYFLVYATTVCALSCPNGQYKNVTAYKCLLCSSVCLTCEISSTNCLTCGPSPFGYSVFLFQTKCLATCPNSYWANSTAYTCDACTVGCATCFNIGLSSCTVCNNDSSTIYYKYIGSTVCNTTCPDGQFVSAAIHNLCQPCSSICVTCFGSAENCTSATCAQNYFFLNNQCLINCPNHYYADSSVRKCLGCATGCSTCFASGNTACTLCSSSYYLQIGNNTCLSICNSGQFANNVGNVCTMCVSACSTCTSYTTCQSCQNVNGIAYFLSGSTCTVSCPSNQFGKLINNQCTNCADGCATCFGAELSNCYSCNASSNSTKFYLMYGTNTCNQICPDGQYANATSFKCMLCNANCLTCISTSSYCLTCGFSTIGANLYLFGSSCLLTCPNGYFANITGNTCDPCHYGCSICTGPFLTNCSVCVNYNNSGTIQVYYKDMAAPTCSRTCPSGQFINSFASNVCAYCDPSCLTCITSSNNCTINACNNGYFYLASNSTCLSVCPPNYYANVTTKNCTVCQPGCQLCYGGSLTTCTKCQITASNVSYYKIIDIDTCTTVCPPGQYPYPLLLACQYCSSTCLTCNTSAIDCQTCNNVSGTPYFYLSNKCIGICPGGYYGQVSNNTCVLCTTGCALCTGGTQNTCSKCTTAATVPYFLVYGTTTCNTSCPNGQYSNTPANSCYPCDANCHTCVGTSTFCLTCSHTATGINLFLQNNKCLQSCSISMYQEVSNNTCIPCNVGCLICTGPNLYECQACRNYTDPINGSFTIYYLTIGNSICGTTCPIGQYIRAGYTNACQACAIQCIGCSITSMNCTQSLLCSLGYFFYRATNSCLSICPNGYYANSTTKFCQPCLGGCTLCSAGDLLSCTMCQTDPGTGVNYYKQIYMSWCVNNCIDGEFEVLSDHSCQPCNPSCILCNQTASTCQKCKNVSGILYYYYSNECLVSCPNGMYGQSSNNTCVNCNPACALCYGPSTVQCYSCRIDNTTNTYYYLSYGTTYCVTTCPYGQYAVNSSFTCQPCNINCATCSGISTNCLTCTYVNTINIVYLHNTVCILTCPNPFWMNSTVPLDHKCSPCHSYCAVCTGPANTECSSCSNQTVNSSQVVYYKDLNSRTCNTTCPNGQFISVFVPNICVPCDAKCKRCAINSTNCFQCDFNYYLYVANNSCVSQCFPNYYNDPVITSNYYYCTQCTSGCLTCTGPGLTNCQTCQPSNTNGTIVYYFKDPTASICNTTCRTGYFGNIINNNCDPCQTGCVTCQANASYCFSCKSAGGNDYFKPKDTNSCVVICPNGYYGNSSDYTCHDCIYYTLNGLCVLTCPSGTFGKLVGSKPICQDCNAPNVTGNPCNRSYTFKVQTTVGDGGNNLVHKVILAGGLSSSVTVDQIRANLSVNVVSPSRRRLLLHGRMLAVSTAMQIYGVSISSDRTVIYITTNFQEFDFSTANVVINFPSNSLISSDGLLYQSTTGSYALSDPVFQKSYYKAFSKSVALGAQGMIFVILSLLLLGMQLVIANRKGYHQALAFIMTLQVIGLTRAMEYPIVFNVFSVLLGYSYFELSFIPNGFVENFPPAYLQNSLQPLTFTFGSQNLILNLGSIIQIYLGLQFLLGIYYLIKNDRPQHVARMKLLQQTLICLFMVIVIYFSMLGMMSLSLNALSTSNTILLASVVISLFLLIGYAIYFLFWVRPFRLFQLYKLNNVARVIGLVIMASNKYAGLIMIDIADILFSIIDLVLYRVQKLNVKMYAAERLMTLIAFNAAVLSPNQSTLLGLMGSTMAVVFIIKLYYTAITTKQFIDQHKLMQASQIDVSDVVNLSVKEKRQPDYSKLQAKQSIDQKINHSQNFIFNESIDISRIDEQPTKHQLLRMDVDSSDREEEEKKENQVPESSSEQSQGELIVYLDPDDYKEEYLRKQEREKQRLKEIEKQKERQKEMKKSKAVEEPRPTTSQLRPTTQARNTRRALKVDGMRTGANFYPKARGPQNHEIIEEDVEVIKVEPNHSEVDQSDLVSDNSEGFGWLDQNDERNVSRAKQNKTVWKIVDEETPKKK